MMWRIITFASVSVIAATLGVWSSDHEPPTRLLKSEVLTPTVRPGGELRIHYTVQRFRSCRVHIDRILYDADRVRRDLEDLEYAAAPGVMGESSYTIAVTIPRNFAQGPARYREITTYFCNPLQMYFSAIVENGDPIKFKVEGEPDDTSNSPIEVIPRR